MTNLPATTNSGAIPGLEDFNASDMVMPRLEIDHKEAKFIDSLSGDAFDELEVVMLGLIKTRSLWNPEPGKEPPFCRSYDHSTGRPDPKNPARFPWRASGFNMQDFEQPDGTIILPCDKCPLKEWGSHPKNDTPWCTEEGNVPVMLPVGDGWAPALMKFQRTSIKPLNAYITSFQRSQTPMFVVTTKMSLSAQMKGTVQYAVPKLVRGTPTPEEFHQEFIENYLRIRSFVQTPRGSFDDDQDDVDTSAAPSAPAAATMDDDNIPF